MHESTRAIGATALTVSSISELSQLFEQVPDPDLVLEKLGRTRADMRSLESDDEISQCLETRREAVASTPWAFEPAEGEVSEWLLEEFKPHMDVIIRGAWAAVPYGYSIVRMLYIPGTNGALIDGIDKPEILPFEWFTYERGGAVGGSGWNVNFERSSGDRRLLKWETDYLYFFTIRSPSWRNPYGEALLTRAYWPWFFRHNSWQFWMKCLERFGTPLLLGKGSDYEALATALAKVVQDAAIAVGPGDDVTAISVANPGAAFDQVELALVRRIQKLILGQTLSSDVGSTGSRALGEVHERVRNEKRDADLRLISSTINRIISAAALLRFGDGVEVPKLVLQDERGLEVERSERDERLATSGIVKFTDEYLLNHYDFKDGDFTIPSDVPIAGSAFSAGGRSAAWPFRFAHAPGHTFTPDQQAIEDNVAAHAGQLSSPIPSEVIMSAIRASTSPEDLTERLALVYEGNNAAEFRAIMEQAIFASDVLGFVSAEEGT